MQPLGDSWDNEFWRTGANQRDEENPIAKLLPGILCGLQPQLRFANSPRSDQSQQPAGGIIQELG